VQRHGVGRGQGRAWGKTLRHQPERAERGGAGAAGDPDLAQEVGGAGLAVGAGDGDDAARLRAMKGGRHQRQRPARIGRGDQWAHRHAGRPFGAFRGEHGRGAAFDRVRDESAAIGMRARQGGEHHAGADRAAVGRQAGDRDVLGRSGEARSAHDLTEAQGSPPAARPGGA
jgi:hypothetical protein